LPGAIRERLRFGKLVRKSSCGWLAARLKMLSAANVNQTLEKNGMEEPLEEAARERSQNISVRKETE
jgi:hypothetical protein